MLVCMSTIYTINGHSHFSLHFPISVGVSSDPASVTMLDSVKVYVKTKEQFGWPEDESEEFQTAEGVNKASPSASASSSAYVSDVAMLAPLPLTSVDR